MTSRGHRYDDLSADELVANFTESGDGDAFAEIFSRYSRNIYHLCYAFFRDCALAEDATSEIFLRAFERRAQFNGGNYLGWLRRIARNTCIDHWRRKAPTISIDTSETETPVHLPSPSPDENMQIALLQMRDEIAKLSPEQRGCLQLQIEGYSYEEIASLSGFSPEMVRSHIQNGRRMLRLRLKGAIAR